MADFPNCWKINLWNQKRQRQQQAGKDSGHQGGDKSSWGAYHGWGSEWGLLGDLENPPTSPRNVCIQLSKETDDGVVPLNQNIKSWGSHYLLWQREKVTENGWENLNFLKLAAILEDLNHICCVLFFAAWMCLLLLRTDKNTLPWNGCLYLSINRCKVYWGQLNAAVFINRTGQRAQIVCHGNVVCCLFLNKGLHNRLAFLIAQSSKNEVFFKNKTKTMLDFWQRYCITLTHTLKVDTWSSGLVVCRRVGVIGWTYLFMHVLSLWTVSVSAYLFPRLSLSHSSLSLHGGCRLLCNAPVRMHEKETRLRLHVKNMSGDTWDCWRARSVSAHARSYAAVTDDGEPC